MAPAPRWKNYPLIHIGNSRDLRALRVNSHRGNILIVRNTPFTITPNDSYDVTGSSRPVKVYVVAFIPLGDDARGEGRVWGSDPFGACDCMVLCVG